jgi:desulfoferrodoxin
MKFYKCEICGEVVVIFEEGRFIPSCCGKEMSLLGVNPEGAATEKHAPVIEGDGRLLTVRVGEQPHPMEEKHHISFITLETTEGFIHKVLKTGDEPKAVFALNETEAPVAAYAYCNLHDLWMTEYTEDTGRRASALVVYFSAEGPTQKVAERLADIKDADLFQIVPEEPYTEADLDWTDSAARSNIEMADKDCRPRIAGTLPSLSGYDIIYLGYPVWWGTAPRIVDTFLNSVDVSGKTIVPFCTSGGSGIEKSERELQALSPEAVFKKGLRVTSATTDEELDEKL